MHTLLEKYSSKLLSFELMGGKGTGCVEVEKAMEVLTEFYSELKDFCEEKMEGELRLAEEKRLSEANFKRLRGE